MDGKAKPVQQNRTLKTKLKLPAVKKKKKKHLFLPTANQQWKAYDDIYLLLRL